MRYEESRISFELIERDDEISKRLLHSSILRATRGKICGLDVSELYVVSRVLVYDLFRVDLWRNLQVFY